MFDLQNLALHWPRLCKYIIKDRIDLSLPEAQRELTCAMAWTQYSLILTFPLKSLTPIIPNRIYYPKWLKSELDLGDHVTGLDIGTGCTAIYPLLGTKLFPGWNWIGTESDKDSFEFACLNVERNQMNEKISIIHTSDYFPNGLLDKLDFVMTNPPFYGSEEEWSRGNSLKSKSKNYTPGYTHEMVTKGGEFNFVLQIIEKSQKRGGIWYSSLFGKKQNYTRMIQYLESQGALIKTCFFHLGKTKRWILAWKFKKD